MGGRDGEGGTAAKESKVAVITGASRGIGRQLALDCARHGLAVAVNYKLSQEAAEAVVVHITEAGGTAVAIHGDVSTEPGAEQLIAGAYKRFGRIDCVINNAGIGDVLSLEELSAADFEHTLRQNLTSAFLVSQAAIPFLKQQGGRLVFMSSLASRIGGRVSAAYAASKGGMEGLMHYYATYLRAYGITANAIAPTLIHTDIVAKMTLPPVETMPFGRLPLASEVWPTLQAILDTEYITGQTLHINGGLFMT